MKIGLVVGWLALCAVVFWSVYSARETVWHVSESAPLAPIPRALPDDGSWTGWRAATLAFNEDGGEELSGTLGTLLSLKDDPPEQNLEALRPGLAARLAALPDPHAMTGWLIPSDDFTADGPSQLPPESMGPARAWIGQAWLLARSGDVDGARQALRTAQRIGVLYEQSGPNLVAVMVGVAIQKLVLKTAIALADRLPMDELLGEITEAQASPSGVPAALRGECLNLESVYETLDTAAFDAAKTGKWAPSLPGGKAPFLYSPTKTLARHRWWCRQLIAQAQAAPEDRTALTPEQLWTGTDPRQWIDNPVGRIMLDISTPAFLQMQERRDALAALRQQLSEAMQARDTRGADATPDGEPPGESAD